MLPRRTALWLFKSLAKVMRMTKREDWGVGVANVNHLFVTAAVY